MSEQEAIQQEIDVLVRTAEVKNSILRAIESRVEKGNIDIPVPPWALADE